MALCQSCRAISFATSIREEKPQRFWGESYSFSTFAILQPSLKALQESANNGCSLCSKFWNLLSSSETQAPDDDALPPVVLLCYHKENDKDWLFNGCMWISCGDNSSWYHSPVLPLPGHLTELFARSKASTSPTTGLPNDVAKQADDSTGSHLNLSLANMWVQDCLLSHEQCTRSSASHVLPALPRRVIDVSDSGNCFLFETHGQREDYLTLSYCWGQGERLLTTKQCYEAFQRRLPTNGQMPLTFREAFIVTRALGHRYLWIDALCIIQDDVNDLNKEMARMGDIYQNSILTIFAEKGPDTDSGLFASRNGAFNKPCNTTIQTIESNKYRRTEVAFVSSQYDYSNPLSKRGWVLQEQILAKRHLKFTPREIQWTCKIRKLSEARPHKVRDYGPNGLEDHETVAQDSLNAMRLLITDPLLFTRMTETVTHLRNHFDAWYRVVVLYCARSLTFPYDKLLAIAGIARLMQSHFGSEYGAGLWKEDLAMGLCWTTESPASEEDDSTEPNELSRYSEQDYIAPSWSWASIENRRVQYHPIYYSGSGTISHECVQVLDWQFSYPADGVVPFGRITSGVLTLQGRLHNALLIPPPKETRSVWVPKPLRHAFMIHTHTTSIIGEVSIDAVDIHKALNMRYRDLPATEREFDYPSKMASRALPVSYLTTYAVDGDEHRRIYALVLVANDLVKQEYRRIGLLCIKVPVPHIRLPHVLTYEWSNDRNRQIVRII